MSKKGSHGAKISVLPGLHSPGKDLQEGTLLNFQASRGHLLSLAHGALSIFKANNGWSSLCHIVSL